MPADDFGVRNGFRIAYKKTDMPKPKELLAHRQTLVAARDHGGVVSLARGGRGQEKEVTRRCRLVIKIFFGWKFPRLIET